MYSDIVILAMLHQQPQHGYELKKAVATVFGGTVSLNNKVLYPALKRFEAQGAVVREVVPQEGKPNRHLYHLTDHGRELLHSSLCDFPPDQAADGSEFFTRVAFFNFLTADEQREILNKRLAYLQGCVEYLQHLQRMADTECPIVAQQRVLAFQLDQARHEAQWVAGWLAELSVHS